MTYFLQRNTAWKNELMGFGSGTIGDFGCYLSSLASGLTRFGWIFNPSTLNQLFKTKNLWIGEFRNYIDVDRLSAVLPQTYEAFIKVEPWNNLDQLKEYLSGKYVVLGKVDARGIGGSGTHFVLIDDLAGSNAIIFDPWTGEYQPVANRYGKLGNILGLRIFKVKNSIINNNEGNDMNTDQFYQKFIEAYRKHKSDVEWGDDKNKPESVLLSDEATIGRMIDSVALDKKSKQERITSLENDLGQKEAQKVKALADQQVVYEKQMRVQANGLNSQIDKLNAKILELEKEPHNVPPNDPKWLENGKTVTTTDENGVVTTINYNRVSG